MPSVPGTLPRLSHRRRLSRTLLRGFEQPGVKPTRSAQPRKMARVFAARSTVHCSARPSSSSPVTSHVELAWVGRNLRARREVAAVVTAAGRVPTGSQVTPERAIERSTPNAAPLIAPLDRHRVIAPLDRHRARIARRCWGSGTLNREGRGIAGAESGRCSLPGCGGSGPHRRVTCRHRTPFASTKSGGDVHPVADHDATGFTSPPARDLYSASILLIDRLRRREGALAGIERYSIPARAAP